MARVMVLCGACEGEGYVDERYVDVDVTDADRCDDCDGAGERAMRTEDVTDEDEVLGPFVPGRYYLPKNQQPAPPQDYSEIPF